MVRRARYTLLLRLVAALLLVLGFGAAAGCHLAADLYGYDIDVLPQANKVDLLLVVDNSRGTIMADKVTLFELAIKRLVTGLAKRVDDLHVGVVTTSLGGVGAEVCNSGIENDHGRLISRAPPDPQNGNQIVPTYLDKGVLAWAPHKPEEPGVFSDIEKLQDSLSLIMQGAGEDGCGFESTLESWYRFLVEPAPYAEVILDKDNRAMPSGVDQTVLLQREVFLRPDSLLIIVVLSDENDCSLRVGGDYYLAAQIQDPNGGFFRLPKPRHACADYPDSTCCTSCGQPPGQYWDESLLQYVTCDTSADPCCEGDEPEPCDPLLSIADDHHNLRCYDQKRRFGVDFLYPIDRYVQALGAKQVQDLTGNVFYNPIYAGNRDPRLVVYGSLIGVPWQDIARRTNGKPDVNEGLDAHGARVGGFQTAAQLRDSHSWDLILGEPSKYHKDAAFLPGDPLMRESVEARSGAHPLVTAAAIAPVDAQPWTNIVNSHEHNKNDELQFTCVFQLDPPVTCGAGASCVCGELDDLNPLCQDPMATDPGALNDGKQHFVQAYPGIRHLQLMKSLGERAVVGSICPVTDALPQSYLAYEPSADALLEVAVPYLKNK